MRWLAFPANRLRFSYILGVACWRAWACARGLIEGVALAFDLQTIVSAPEDQLVVVGRGLSQHQSDIVARADLIFQSQVSK